MKPQKPSSRPASRRLTRHGFTTPAVAIALLVVMAGLALIVDRLWLDSADLELTTAAEAAALAAASELASDEQLKAKPDPEVQRDAARRVGAWIALQNRVAGDPVELNSEPDGDIRLGHLILDDEAAQIRFEETEDAPNTAVVTAMRTRISNNPVSLFVTGVTGIPFGDVVSRVEAAVDNRVRGVRPQEGAPVPAFPLAIWRRDPSGRRQDTWEVQIESRKGPDNFGYDAVSRRVYRGADGIPEIVLHSQPRGQTTAASNILVVDLGTRLNDRELQRQFQSGWTAEDLATLGGELIWPATYALRSSAEVRHGDRESLTQQLGEPRLCLLYDKATPSGPREQIADCSELVAIRVLSIQDLPDGSCEFIAQPCVVKTKTALLNSPTPYDTEEVRPVSPYRTGPEADRGSAAGHAYLYKLQLTH